MCMIVPLSFHHCEEAAQLHLNLLASDFKGLPGKKLLSIYYKALTETEGASGFAAVKNGRAAGYICGIWNPVSVRLHLIKRYWYKLLFWYCIQLFLYPKTVISLFDRIRSLCESRNTNEIKQGYELRPIAVNKNLQGTGVASSLIKRLIKNADEKGFNRIHLITEIENISANAFYRKTGFIATDRSFRKGKEYIYYEYTIQRI